MSTSTSQPDGESFREEVISRIKALVEKYPNDLNYRGLLGTALFQGGLYSEAIPELQQAMRLPALRPFMLLSLHECYLKVGMRDLSLNQLRTLLSEIPRP